MVVSYREAPPRWRQGRGRESKAGACAKHVVVIARLAADLVSRGSVKRPCWAAAVVAVEAAGVSVFPGRVVVLGLGDVAAVDFSSFLYCREAVSLRL